MVQSAASSNVGVSAAEKPSDASGGDAPGRWHPRSGDGLSYQALALGHGAPFLQRVRVVQEKSPSRAGVVPMARSDHWRCLHTQMGSYREGDLQLPAQYKPFQDLGRVRRRVGTEQGLSGEGALGVSDQHPANEDGGLAGAVPDRRLGGEFHGAGDAVVPGHLGAEVTSVCSRKTFSGGRRGPFNGGRPWPAAGAWAASRRNLAIRVTGSRRDWSSGANARHSCCRPPTRGRWGSQRRSCPSGGPSR